MGEALRTGERQGRRQECRRIPRHSGRLRHDRGRHGHRAHRTDVRRRRRQGCQGRRHTQPLRHRQGWRHTSHGRLHRQVLREGRHGRSLRGGMRRRQLLGTLRRLREERLRPEVQRGRQVRREGCGQGDGPERQDVHRDEGRRHSLPHREARAQLSALLAHRQTHPLLPARLVVHPRIGSQGAHDRAQPHHPLEARKHRHRTLRQVAREPQRLEPLALALLGHAPAHLAQQGHTRGNLHQLRRTAVQ